MRNLSLGRRYLVNAYEVKAGIGVIAGKLCYPCLSGLSVRYYKQRAIYYTYVYLYLYIAHRPKPYLKVTPFFGWTDRHTDRHAALSTAGSWRLLCVPCVVLSV